MSLNDTEKCRWKTTSCPDCEAQNPLSTDAFCRAAIALYYASGNILCPKCSDGYMRLRKKKYICEKCGNATGYQIILDSLGRMQSQ